VIRFTARASFSSRRTLQAPLGCAVPPFLLTYHNPCGILQSLWKDSLGPGLKAHICR
jgi:hypothetical protein